ncbi:hypothetical protein [Burkholderia glumae]|uniref:hypothetical protein n=1 Tax=Burkholderia glumae TaxID=337 RepID=UPI0021505D7C|nr:hypothetical protein [Burkholderia glumae]
MTDKELLELAAKAYGLTNPKWVDMAVWGEIRYGISEAISSDDDDLGYWNPLVSDGDALRLAVKLKLDMHFETQENYMGEMVEIFGPEEADGSHHCEAHGLGDDHAATVRRAITRAAAEIARTTDTGGEA